MIIFLAIFVIISIALIIRELKNAPYGVEDENGFHLLKDQREIEKYIEAQNEKSESNNN